MMKALLAIYRRPGDCMKFCRHILSSLDKVLIEKQMFVQVGLFCTSNLSSGTALQQDFVIRKLG